VIALGATLGTVFVVLAATTPAYADSGRAARQLAKTYSPVVMLRDFHAGCGEGEHFVPMRVDALLDNPEIALRQVGNRDAVIEWASSGADLYGRGTGTYLDLPGDALAPGCIYADDSARYTPLSESAVYAHVATQANRPGYVAVQYWLYWYYNDWNDKHESDWEFIQVLFRADSVDAALHTDPIEVGYAQHTGGETADWDSEKLEKEGTHPVVYSSEGSHASYFEPALHLGRSASEGFGCDNTQEPNTRVAPPRRVAARAALRSRRPLRVDGLRRALGGAARRTEQRSRRTARQAPVAESGELGGEPPPVVVRDPRRQRDATQGGRHLLRRRRTRLGDLRPVRRPAGGCAGDPRGHRLGGGVPATTDALGQGVAVPGGRPTPLRGDRPSGRDPVPPPRPDVRGGRPARRPGRGAGGVGRRRPPAPAVRGLGGARLHRAGAAGQPHPLLVVGRLELLAADRAADVGHGGSPDGRRPEPAHAAARREMREVGSRWRELASAYLPAAVAIVFLSWTGIGLPVAAWLTVRFQFLGQIVMREDLSGSAARARAGELVRHRWWHTAVVALIVWAGIHALGVLLGLLLLVAFTSLPLWTITAVVLVAQIALTPLGAIALTMLYGDAVAQREEELRTPVPVA
jgi:Vacuolar protein sorting-associated protein 62